MKYWLFIFCDRFSRVSWDLRRVSLDEEEIFFSSEKCFNEINPSLEEERKIFLARFKHSSGSEETVEISIFLSSETFHSFVLDA